MSYHTALTKTLLGLLVITLAAFSAPAVSYGQGHEIDAARSTLRIRVLKSGVFSAFAHDHQIEAPIDEGRIDSSATPSVQLRVDARKMRVMDPELSAANRSEIQQTMESTTVLDAMHFPEISYQSTGVNKTGDASWEILGDLTLHGHKQPVDVTVSLQGNHYRGSAALKQSTFGITPIKIAGGAVKVKDEVRIEFDIVPVQ